MVSMRSALLTVAALGAGVSLAAASSNEANAVIQRAAAYLADYEWELSSVVAEETYAQRVVTYPVQGLAFGNRQAKTRRRELVSDFLLIRHRDQGWQGFRDVYVVDGQTIRDRENRFERLVLTGDDDVPVSRRWRRLAEESARYNIGTAHRTINVPTFALLVLRDSHRGRMQFETDGHEEVFGTPATVIRFREREGPPLITEHGAPRMARGRLWIDPRNGRILRTEIETGDGHRAVHARVRVEYHHEPSLDLYVPISMSERYHSDGGQTIECEATYANYRSFGVDVQVGLPDR